MECYSQREIIRALAACLPDALASWDKDPEAIIVSSGDTVFKVYTSHCVIAEVVNGAKLITKTSKLLQHALRRELAADEGELS